MKIIQFDPTPRYTHPGVPTVHPLWGWSKQARQFLGLPHQLYRQTPQWVPPLEIDLRRLMDSRRHPFYQHSKAAFFLALNDQDQAAGRLAVLNNHHYNEYNNEKTAFFYLFECEQRYETAQGLFAAGFEWARSRGLEKIIGSKGFTALDGQGILVQGFQHRPAFGIPYNPPYYPEYLERLGFTPLSEVVSGYLDCNAQFPERIHRASELIQKRRGLRVAVYRRRQDLRALTPKLKEMYNNALAGTTGNVPLTDEEAHTLADQLLLFADPSLIKIIMKDDTPVGFLFAYPDISAALQRTGGKLFPFGWFALLREIRQTQWVNLNGAGIVEQYRGAGGTAILFSEMAKTLVGSRFKHADIVQIGVENDRMQRELRELGIDFYKKHRLYERKL